MVARARAWPWVLWAVGLTLWLCALSGMIWKGGPFR